MDISADRLLEWKGIAVFAWLILLFLIERLRPAAREAALNADAKEAGGWHRLLRNLGLWLANVGLSPLIVLPLSLWAVQFHLGWRPGWWAGGAGLLLDILLFDFLIYWWHRVNHMVPLLWRFHEIHHLDNFLDTTSALRFHFGEVLLSALTRAGMIIVFDIPFSSILIFEAAVLIAAIFHHSNIALPKGLEHNLARLIITPSIHWVHHHAERRDTDSNYGTIFSFWDLLFGSKSESTRRLDMVIGVERRPEQSFLQLLLRPFLSAHHRS